MTHKLYPVPLIQIAQHGLNACAGCAWKDLQKPASGDSLQCAIWAVTFQRLANSCCYAYAGCSWTDLQKYASVHYEILRWDVPYHAKVVSVSLTELVDNCFHAYAGCAWKDLQKPASGDSLQCASCASLFQRAGRWILALWAEHCRSYCPRKTRLFHLCSSCLMSWLSVITSQHHMHMTRLLLRQTCVCLCFSATLAISHTSLYVVASVLAVLYVTLTIVC